MEKNTWTKHWPTEPGYYWFYGWCFSYDYDVRTRQKPYPIKHYFVEARKVSNGVLYVTDGHFLSKAEGALGIWCVAELPAPPSMDIYLNYPPPGKE